MKKTLLTLSMVALFTLAGNAQDDKKAPVAKKVGQTRSLRSTRSGLRIDLLKYSSVIKALQKRNFAGSI